MKTQKIVLGNAGLKILLLAIGLSSLPLSASASAMAGDSASPATLREGLRAPLSLGGVSLARYQPWQPAARSTSAKL